MKEKPHTKDYILTDLQIRRVADSLRSPVERLVVLGLLYTGMRISEFIHMRRSWINWDEKLIRVPREQPCPCYECKRVLRNKKGQVTKPSGVWKPKTSDSVRPIPIVPEVEHIFRDYFKNHKSIMETIGSRVHAWMILKDVEERSGVKLFPHVLRGTFATILAAKEFTVEEIKEILGWRSFKTADEYIKLSGARIKKAIKEKW
jgi:integrase